MHEIIIGPYKIGSGQPPFIIAEMSGNHNQSLDRALEIVDAAKAAGVHALKLQTYTADTMTLDIHKNEFLITDKNSLWYGKTLYELYKQAYTPWEWHKPIFDRCKKLGLICFSTPFDATAVDFLESLNTPCYKIASLEITDLPLIQKAASTKKPLIISTGAATLEEISEAVGAARKGGCHELILLKCTSAYPTPPELSNLRSIPFLSHHFDAFIGLSDHTPGIGAAIASVVLGSCVIEKHLTLSRADGGVDAAFSLEPSEFASLVTECNRAWLSLGEVLIAPADEEATSRSHRRSLYFVKDLNVGDTVKPEHIRAIRPGSGLPPKEYEQVIGRTINKPVKRGDPVQWNQLNNPV